MAPIRTPYFFPSCTIGEDRLARAKIPEHMYRDRGANPGKGVDLPGIG